jgi:hypothetical protein
MFFLFFFFGQKKSCCVWFDESKKKTEPTPPEKKKKLMWWTPPRHPRLPIPQPARPRTFRPNLRIKPNKFSRKSDVGRFLVMLIK